jgi:iron complex outermembrane recepter protein
LKQGNSNFILDLQIRNISYNATGELRNHDLITFDKNYLFFNPKLGWNLNLNSEKSIQNSSNIYAFLGMSNREPVRSDFIDEEATHQPLPEQVYNLELGFKHKKNDLEITTNLFGMYFLDQLIPTGNVNSVGAPIRENVAKSYRAGVELEFKKQLLNTLSFYTSQYVALNKIMDYTNYLITYNDDYSINDAKTIKQNFSSTDIAFSPSWISYTALKFEPFFKSKTTKTSIELMNKIVSSQFLDNTMTDSKSLPFYSYTNLSISHELKINNWLKDVKLNLLLNNIFDQKYSCRGYTYFSGNTANIDGTITSGQDYNYYFPQAGFNFLAGVSMKW